MKEQHIKLSISVNGLNKVAFSEDLGWMYAMSGSVDLDSLEEAKDTAITCLENLQLMPCENMGDNEEFLGEADNVISDMIKTLADAAPTAKYESSSEVISIIVEFEETYEVDFGE